MAEGYEVKQKQFAKPAAGKNDKLSTPPDEKGLIQMTPEQLDDIIAGIRKETAETMNKLTDRIDKMALRLESEQKIGFVKTRGGGQKISVEYSGSPLDHQSRLAQTHSEKLKGKRARFITNDPNLRALRRYQGYDPVLDESGNEVRYMDGVLMTMNKDKYREEILKPKKERQALLKDSARHGERFRAQAEELGVEIEGTGISYDKPVHSGDDSDSAQED
jgi:hypothetical protein